MWQFTLAATSANTEAIRIARTITGREKVLFFDGKYHGHFDEALVERGDGGVDARGGRPARRRHDRTMLVPFNDLDALERALASAESRS